MKKWMLVAAALVVVALAGGYYGATARAGAKLQGCEDWVDQTNARVQDARSLLYPADRPDAFQGTPSRRPRSSSRFLRSRRTATHRMPPAS